MRSEYSFYDDIAKLGHSVEKRVRHVEREPWVRQSSRPRSKGKERGTAKVRLPCRLRILEQRAHRFACNAQRARERRRCAPAFSSDVNADRSHLHRERGASRAAASPSGAVLLRLRSSTTASSATRSPAGATASSRAWTSPTAARRLTMRRAATAMTVTTSGRKRSETSSSRTTTCTCPGRRPAASKTVHLCFSSGSAATAFRQR